MIRHARLRQAPAVLTLTVAVIEPSFLAALVSAIGRTALLAAPLRRG